MYEGVLHLNYTPCTKSWTYDYQISDYRRLKTQLVDLVAKQEYANDFCYELKLEFSIILLWRCKFRRSFFEFRLKFIHLHNWARKRHSIFLLSVQNFLCSIDK